MDSFTFRGLSTNRMSTHASPLPSYPYLSSLALPGAWSEEERTVGVRVKAHRIVNPLFLYGKTMKPGLWMTLWPTHRVEGKLSWS